MSENIYQTDILKRIDLVRLYILFSQYRSCDDTQEIWSFVLFIKKRAEGHFVCACSAESILMWVTAGLRLLCVDANRKMAVVLTSFSAVFPFVTCVKESENQPNGFGKSRRKSQPSPLEGQAWTNVLDLIICFYQLSWWCKLATVKRLIEGIFVKDALQKACSAQM